MGLMMVFGRKLPEEERADMMPWGYEMRKQRTRSSYPDGDWEHEMRRRRAFMPGDDEDDMEMRRRRRSAYDNHYPVDPNEEMRRRRMMDEGHEIGFGHPHPMEEMRAEMHHMRKELDELKGKGYASVKKLAPNLEGVLDDAADLLERHPQTWDMYMQRKDYRGIAKMEGKELLDALEAGKSAKDVRKELVHTIAALLLMVQ